MKARAWTRNLAGRISVDRRSRRRTPRDLGWQVDGLDDVVVAGLDGALQCRVGAPQLLADVEALGQDLDQAELDHNVRVSALLHVVSATSDTQTRAHIDRLLDGAGRVDDQLLAGFGRIGRDLERGDLDRIGRQAAAVGSSACVQAGGRVATHSMKSHDVAVWTPPSSPVTCRATSPKRAGDSAKLGAASVGAMDRARASAAPASDWVRMVAGRVRVIAASPGGRDAASNATSLT